MKIIAGVDVGNSTTEVCVGSMDEEGKIQFLSSASRVTTGTKGTIVNVHGIKAALEVAMTKIGKEVNQIDLIRLNEAAPVIGDTAMETITETIITESSMIGHNPSTPAGVGQAMGRLLLMEHLHQGQQQTPYIVVANSKYSYELVAKEINKFAQDLDIRAIILQADEAVLVENRLQHKIPIIDEVVHIDQIIEGKTAAVEVALPGESIRMLSNPYGIATLLGLNANETKMIIPIAKSLIGKRSAVVIKSSNGNVKEQILPAGEIRFDAQYPASVSIDEGAEKIMELLEVAGNIYDISGQENTNVGNMLQQVKASMVEISGEKEEGIKITDILAVDTLAPVKISGALAGESCMEKAVGIAAMVKTQQLPMEQIAEKLEKELQTKVVIAGVEAVMASIGALTTPGTTVPLAILDMGGGSTDAAIIDEHGNVMLTHQAGAGELVSMLIQIELGLSSRIIAEQIKKYPLAKVESLFHLRLENGEVQFFQEPLDPKFYGQVVLLVKGELIRIEGITPMERIVQVRRDAKRKVFLPNAKRALKKVAPNGKIKEISNVVLVGGSAEDFEIPEMLMEEFANDRIVCGRGNIRGIMGARNAVATGLLLSYMGECS